MVGKGEGGGRGGNGPEGTIANSDCMIREYRGAGGRGPERHRNNHDRIEAALFPPPSTLAEEEKKRAFVMLAISITQPRHSGPWRRFDRRKSKDFIVRRLY